MIIILADTPGDINNIMRKVSPRLYIKYKNKQYYSVFLQLLVRIINDWFWNIQDLEVAGQTVIGVCIETIVQINSSWKILLLEFGFLLPQIKLTSLEQDNRNWFSSTELIY